MRTVDLRSEGARGEGARAAVKTFLERLAKSRLEEARAIVGSGFRWFGREVSAEDWAGPAIAAFTSEPMSFSALRAIPREVIDLVPPDRRDAVLGGTTAATDLLYLVDIARSGKVVTAGVVVACADAASPLIARLFDPCELADVVKLVTTIEDFAEDPSTLLE